MPLSVTVNPNQIQKGTAVSRLTDLLARAKAKDAQLGADLEREFKVLSSRLPFGLNFERHSPEAVELPLRPVRKGDKVRVLPPRGVVKKGDQRLWQVKAIHKTSKTAELELVGTAEAETQTAALDDLVVVAEFRDTIYPGLVSTGKVERGGDKPFHTVINGENYHVLKALTYTHRGKIDAIYIDPPYNTGAKDWKYNNDYVEGDDLYRHSKWLAMMERRLHIVKSLLNPKGSVLIVSIDEKEYLRLGLLLEQVLPEARIQMVSTLINPAGGARAGSFGRNDEYLFFAMFGDAAPQRVRMPREWAPEGGRTHTGTLRWDLLRRSGHNNAARADRPALFYPIYIDAAGPSIAEIGEPLPDGVHTAPEKHGLITLLPIRQNGSEGNWQAQPKTLRERIKQGRVRVTGSEKRGYTISTLKNGEYEKVLRGEFEVIGRGADGSLIVADVDTSHVLIRPSTQWRVAGHDATQYGTRLLNEIIAGRKFPFPKSLYAVEDSLRFFVADKPNAIVLDFFSGSGTTAHAVMRLNRQDGGSRQCISVTNNEVAADEQRTLQEQGFRPGDPDWEKHGICDYITKPRVNAVITGKTPDGKPIKGDYKFVDEFPIAEGFEENAEFFTLTYEAKSAVNHNLAYARVAPLLWLRAGARGRRIDKLPAEGWALADTYGLLTDVDQATPFIRAVGHSKGLRVAYIVTDDDRRFQAIANRLPDSVEPVRLYESYLSNFSFANGE
jgi:adenine-specific DNA-methyltransferase